MELQESQTWKNIETALNAEARAYVEYVFYSQQAKKDDYVQISNIFMETANNELRHAKLLFKMLHDNAVPHTLEGLKLAREEEHYEWAVQYKQFAEIAKQEGFEELATWFHDLAEIEHSHMDRYDQLIENLENKVCFKRDTIQVWYCTTCGYIHVGKEAPLICPVCKHDQGHFEIKATNF